MSNASADRSLMNTDETSSSQVPRSVGRVLDVLEAVLVAGECNLTAVATACDLTPTTALRHLRALEARGYIDRDGDGTFSVGPTMLRLAASLGDTDPTAQLVSVAQPHLDALASETGESTYLAVSDGRIATYVATAESDRAIRHVGWIGQRVTLDGTAVGDALRSPGKRVTRTGAVEPDITAISVAIPAPGKLGVALSIIGPEHRFTRSSRISHEEALGRVADRLAGQLGVGAAVAS